MISGDSGRPVWQLKQSTFLDIIQSIEVNEALRCTGSIMADLGCSHNHRAIFSMFHNICFYFPFFFTQHPFSLENLAIINNDRNSSGYYLGWVTELHAPQLSIKI